MASSATVWPFKGTKIAVLADCHIHPGGGPAFPDALLEALSSEDVDVIVTLGDMGEAAGLDQLAEIAPVIGVRGVDDSDDPRTNQKFLRLKTERYDLGCVFDAKAAGLAQSVDPFDQAADFAALSKRLFGVYVDVLLHASTHKAEEGHLGPRGAALNPGSAVLPAEGCEPTWLLLNVSPDGCYGRIVPVA
jgi:predicted phosphodiesterase